MCRNQIETSTTSGVRSISIHSETFISMCTIIPRGTESNHKHKDSKPPLRRLATVLTSTTKTRPSLKGVDEWEAAWIIGHGWYFRAKSARITLLVQVFLAWHPLYRSVYCCCRNAVRLRAETNYCGQTTCLFDHYSVRVHFPPALDPDDLWGFL